MEELHFNGAAVTHMIFRMCVNDEEDALDFSFDIFGATSKFTSKEFQAIMRLHCGQLPTKQVVNSSRLHRDYFGS